jgi:hypothetical protein
LHTGVIPEHAAQLGPQCDALSHGAQVPALQYIPAAHWASITQSTQAVLPALHTSPEAAQFKQLCPQC